MILTFKDKLLLILFFIVLLTSLWVNNIYLLVLFSVVTVLLFQLQFWDKICTLLMLFSLSYAMMVIFHGDFGSGFVLISYIIAPVAFYMFGIWLMYMFYEDTLRQKLFLAIVLCYSLTLYMFTVKDTAIVGVVNKSRILLEDVGETVSLAATLYGMMASVGIGCVAAIFSKSQKITLRLCFIILAVFSLFVAIHLVNRTGIVMFVSCLAVSLLVTTKLEVIRMIPIVALVFIIGLLMIKSGIVDEEIFIAYQERELSSTSNAYELGGRSGIWLDALQNLIIHPFGWPHKSYAHNLWLDIARIGGWLPLFFFLLATIEWIKKCLGLIINPTTFALLLFSINFAIFLAAFVEPVIEGSILFFNFMMMIWGSTTVVSHEEFNIDQ